MKMKNWPQRIIALSLLVVLSCMFILASDISEPTQKPLKDLPADKSGSDPTAFISVWDPSLISYRSSDYNQVRLPLVANGSYAFTVDWGDGRTDSITQWDQAEVTHTYISQSSFTITITGVIQGWRFFNGGDKLKLLEIQQWGSLNLGNEGHYFHGCANLNITATDALNLTGTSSLYAAFDGCKNLGNNGNIGDWDVSQVTNMLFTFSHASSFDQDLGEWEVSSVTNMMAMFYGASAFNQDISGWNVSQCQNMAFMFANTSAFNQDISEWDVSQVTTMNAMFYEAFAFNQDISGWDVSQVSDMGFMFAEALVFDQELGDWNVSSVIFMEFMLRGVTLSPSNYDHLLIGWSQLPLQQGVSFSAGYSQYTEAGQVARQTIISDFGWTISDWGLKEPDTDDTESRRIPGYPLSIFFGMIGVACFILVVRKYIPVMSWD